MLLLFLSLKTKKKPLLSSTCCCHQIFVFLFIAKFFQSVVCTDYPDFSLLLLRHQLDPFFHHTTNDLTLLIQSSFHILCYKDRILKMASISLPGSYPFLILSLFIGFSSESRILKIGVPIPKPLILLLSTH